MNFISGIASGTFGTLLLGVLGLIFGARRMGTNEDTQTQLIEDAGQLLATHLAPLIKALDNHGKALLFHGRTVDRATGALGTHTAATTGIISPALTAMTPELDRLAAQARAAATPAPAPAPAPAAPAVAVSCGVLHTDGQGNPIPCPGVPNTGYIPSQPTTQES